MQLHSTRHLWPLAFALMLLAMGESSAFASCPSTPEDVEAHARAALGAFAEARDATFASQREEMRQDLGCLNAVPTPTQAALAHQVEGLHWFFVKDKERSIGAFQAMMESDPTLSIDPAVAPVDGPVDFWRAQAALMPPASRAQQTVPVGYTLYVDGKPSTSLPVARQSVSVLADNSGHVVWSGLLPAEAGLPQIALPPRTKQLAKPVLLGAGGVALASGALWAFTLVDRARVQDVSVAIGENATEAELGMTWEEAEALHRRTNALGYAAQASSGVAVGLGVLGLVWAW